MLNLVVCKVTARLEKVNQEDVIGFCGYLLVCEVPKANIERLIRDPNLVDPTLYPPCSFDLCVTVPGGFDPSLRG
jgi:hypothetical protein